MGRHSWAGVVAVAALAVVACSGPIGDAAETTTATVSSENPATTVAPVDAVDEPSSTQGALLYRFEGELFVDGSAVGVATAGPARWRPGYPTQVTYGRHPSERLAGVFLFEQAYLHDIETGEDQLLLDINDHGWEEAGHFDWDSTGSRVVFAAREAGELFRPHVLDVATGEVTQVPTEIQIIDTVFTANGRILGVDTSGAPRQSETVAWIDSDGTVNAMLPSEGVNRDPAASPDMRYVANIRAVGALSRVGIGRWDLVITDLTSGEEWTIGDGNDGFGPPRWAGDRTLVAKHARYNASGIVASIPDVVAVDVATGEMTVVEGRTAAWDPDPQR